MTSEDPPREGTATSGLAEFQRGAQLAVQVIAADALRAGVGGTLPTSADYQAQLSVGAGTVQKALALLAASNALLLQARGHLGRRILAMDVGALWRSSGFDTVSCLMPPPGPLEFRGLDEGMSAQFERFDVPLRVLHQRGAQRRLKRLLSGEVDLVVVSQGVAQSHLVDPAVVVCTPLEPGTYYGEGRVQVVQREAWDPDTEPSATRVAIDRSSWDHVWITEAEFPPEHGYHYVAHDFPRAPVAIASDVADVAVWHEAQLLVPLRFARLALRPLRRDAARQLLRSRSAAALVQLADRRELMQVLSRLDLQAISGRQKHLIELPSDAPELLEGGWIM